MKIFGILLLAGSILGIGALKSSEYKRQVSHCRGILELLRFIRSQIAIFQMPLNDIYTNFDSAIDQGLFDQILHEQGFNAALSEAGDLLSLPKELITYLKELCFQLGKSDREEQVALCDRYIDRIQELYNEKEKCLGQNLKVYRTVSIAGALGAIILFL